MYTGRLFWSNMSNAPINNKEVRQWVNTTNVTNALCPVSCHQKALRQTAIFNQFFVSHISPC